MCFNFNQLIICNQLKHFFYFCKVDDSPAFMFFLFILKERKGGLGFFFDMICDKGGRSKDSKKVLL